MRRKDREMPRDFAIEVVDKCEYAVLSMADLQGNPYAVPITICRDGDFIYFHCARQGKKTDILQDRAEVCVVCVGDTRRAKDDFTTEFESAVVMGTAEQVNENGEKIHALRLLCERHTPDNMTKFDEAIKRSLKVTAVWKIHIDEATGKRKKLS